MPETGLRSTGVCHRGQVSVASGGSRGDGRCGEVPLYYCNNNVDSGNKVSHFAAAADGNALYLHRAAPPPPAGGRYAVREAVPART